MPKRILILGGGFGGMFAAREIRKRLGQSVEVELINADNYFMFQPLLPEVAAGAITAPHTVTPLRMLLKGIFFRMAKVAAVDVERQIVTVFQGVQRRPTDQPHLSGPICLLVHDRPLVHLDDGFWGRRAVAQSTVWSFRVVVFPPFFDQDLGLAQAVKDLAVQELVSEPCVEAFAVSVLPW